MKPSTDEQLCLQWASDSQSLANIPRPRPIGPRPQLLTCEWYYPKPRRATLLPFTSLPAAADFPPCVQAALSSKRFSRLSSEARN